MTRVGVIARADAGGLAQLTCELIRNVRPYAALVVDLATNGRGPVDLARVEPYVERMWVAEGPWIAGYRFPQSCDPFFEAVDVVYTAETTYDERVVAICHGTGKRLVLHAMPELLSQRDVVGAHDLWLPTGWEWERVKARRRAVHRPDPVLMRVPVAVDRYESRYYRRAEAQVLFVHGGEAFHDRNGLHIVHDALAHVERPTLLYVRGGEWPTSDTWTVGHVTVKWLPAVDDYVDMIPAGVDVMIMPRRYGGLTLPVGEAAAQGIPTIMSNLSPQTGWIHSDLRVPMLDSYPVEMKGGMFPVWTTEPHHLATIINMLRDTPARVERASDDAHAWALDLDWRHRAVDYRDAFGMS